MAGDLEPRRGGALQSLDNALLVVVAVVGVLVVLKIIGFIATTIFFFVKLLIGAAVVYALLRAFSRSRR